MFIAFELGPRYSFDEHPLGNHSFEFWAACEDKDKLKELTINELNWSFSGDGYVEWYDDVVQTGENWFAMILEIPDCRYVIVEHVSGGVVLGRANTLNDLISSMIVRIAGHNEQLLTQLVDLWMDEHVDILSFMKNIDVIEWFEIQGG